MKQIKNKSVSLFLLLLVSLCSFAQKEPKWDRTDKVVWDSLFQRVEIKSSYDGKVEPAYLYSSKSHRKKPLIVSLHTWSGDYTQEDPIRHEVVARDWNYIHPNFRGANNHKEAMGSEAVIADIEDAIKYALKNTNSDPNEVHVIGTSGGGYATLLAYMTVKYPVKSFSAWAPISDIESWYWESKGARRKYAKDILKSLGSQEMISEEARERSPLYRPLPRNLRKGASLFIYEGIHDGYRGSVPITHSINMYNRIVGGWKYNLSDMDSIMKKAELDNNLVSRKEIIDLVTKQLNPGANPKDKFYERQIHFKNSFGNINLTLFEGGHEQLPQALSLIPVNYTSETQKLNIVTIGDSNGDIPHGWTTQLKKMLPNCHIFNNSKSGRTIGFKNMGRNSLNALQSIDQYLDSLKTMVGSRKVDYIIVCLGTNDAKTEFADRQEEVPENFRKLLRKIKKSNLANKAKLIYMTPTPIRKTNVKPRYMGGNSRLERLVPQLVSIAKANGYEVVDNFHPMQGIEDYYAADGVHMSADGQKIIASRIIDILK